MRSIARALDLAIILAGVALPLMAHFVAHHDWLFTFSLIALALPGGYVFTRHLLVYGSLPPNDADVASFHRSCVRYYWAVFPLMVGIIISQLVVPGEFKGADAVFVAFIVLALGRLADVVTISLAYRKIEVARRYVMAPKIVRKSGLTSRSLSGHVRPTRRRLLRINLS